MSYKNNSLNSLNIYLIYVFYKLSYLTIDEYILYVSYYSDILNLCLKLFNCLNNNSNLNILCKSYISLFSIFAFEQLSFLKKDICILGRKYE
jgi:hypothetical protein